MRRPSLLRSVLRYVSFSVFGALVVLVGMVRIQQYVVRHRAEQLLIDIQHVELRRTRFEDAETLFVRWRKWGHYEGECTEQRCSFKITFEDFWGSHASLWKKPSLEMLYNALGGRASEVYAGVRVMDGVVWEKWFGFGAGSKNASHAEVSTTAWLLAADQRFSLHPNYHVDANLPYCEDVSVQFTPYEDPVEIHRLMEFNLSALTHWGFDRDKSDVMPAACGQAMREQHLIADTHNQLPVYELPRQESLEYLARDATKVAIVKILDKRNQDGRWQLKIQLIEPLKRYSPPGEAMVQEVHLQCRDVSLHPDIQVGGRYLIFTDDPQSANIICGGIVPAGEDNLAITRRGISQDYEFAFNEPNAHPRGAYGPPIR